MASIEQRLLRAWKQKRGMRLSAEEVELLMNRGLKYMQSAEELTAVQNDGDGLQHGDVSKKDDPIVTEASNSVGHARSTLKGGRDAAR